jgi:hypothetical protein
MARESFVSLAGGLLFFVKNDHEPRLQAFVLVEKTNKSLYLVEL